MRKAHAFRSGRKCSRTEPVWCQFRAALELIAATHWEGEGCRRDLTRAPARRGREAMPDARRGAAGATKAHG
jgi:hypothetical protein